MQVNNIDRVSFSSQERDCVMTGSGAVRRTYNPYTAADTAILDKKAAKPEEAFAKKQLSPVEAHQAARDAFLNYFKNTFAQSDKFKEVFGSQTWNDIADQVIYDLDLNRDKKSEMAIYQDKAYVFSAEAAGITGEVVIDKKTGTAKKITVDAN